MIAGAVTAGLLTVIVAADPGTSARGAVVRAGTARAVVGEGGRARLGLAPGTYDLTVTKPGFAPAHARVVVRTDGDRVRVALHLAPSSALRTIGAVSAAERGASNTSPVPETTVPREAYRDMSQPGLDDVLTQKPALAIDRAGRGLSADDAPPVALVRGGTPLETQTLINGVPVEPATTRALALTAIPTFVLQELEVEPGASAPLPTIDGAVNGSLNLRFAEPVPVLRALPEQGFDGRGGSFSDLTGGGALDGGQVAFGLAAAIDGENGDVAATNVLQRAALLTTRAALSPSGTLTLTGYDESDTDELDQNHFAFSEAEYRLDGAQSALLARAWHVEDERDGVAAGDPLEIATDDRLTGGQLELDRTVGGSLFSAGVTTTGDEGTAAGAIVVPAGSSQTVTTAFLRAILHAGTRWNVQLTGYDVDARTVVPGRVDDISGLAGRAGLAYRLTDRLTLRASSGAGFTPPSLVALAGVRGPLGVEAALTDDVGLDAHVIDAHTTLSADVFTQTGNDRLVEELGPDPWVDAGPFTRHGAEFSLARFVPAGFGYVLQAWTASETPSLAGSIGDVASGNTHGYAEASYHWRNGSRFSFGATYYGADPLLAQRAAVLLNSNLEIQLGRRGKIQFDLENLNNQRLAITSLAVPVLAARNAFAPAPRTFRIVIRRSVGRTGTDNG
ncbi:MAG TPA: TonB-dependent receptor [Candidatus Sulfotelmatobacter sp.]|nr:TonB-dependent receptor [Candidatus Sulfotelmatobacter sp.]